VRVELSGYAFAVMAVAHKITAFDLVELTEAVEDVPAGALGGVLELRDSGTAMIEIIRPELGPAERIVFVPLNKLRLVEPARPS
jgi:hypothetical protein